MPELTARERIATYVRLLGDWWTSPQVTADRTEQVYAAVRDEVLAEAAELLRAHCPQHANGDTAFMSCHCPAATELERVARAAADAPHTN